MISSHEESFVVIPGHILISTHKVLEVPPSSSDIDATYDLIANITHETIAGTTRDVFNTAWKVVLRAPKASKNSDSEIGEEDGGNAAEDRWIGIQDLIVEEIRPEMIFLGETVLQIWERKGKTTSKVRPAGIGMDVEMTDR